MPDIFYLISKWWKQMLAIVIVSVAAAASVLYVLPSKYLSTATALPASAYTADKGNIFNQNIQSLYPAMGASDDLDKIIGTAQLDTVYIAVAKEFNLYDHYKITGEPGVILSKAAYLLKLNTKVIKSDYGELKVKVWDTDKQLAPQLANSIMQNLNAIHQSVQNESNAAVLNNLKIAREKIRAETDSLTGSLQYDSSFALLRSQLITTENKRARTIRRNVLLAQLEQYEKLISEYQLMVDSRTPVLIIVEQARVSAKPDKPKRLEILIATFVLSILFALLLALILEKRKVTRK